MSRRFLLVILLLIGLGLAAGLGWYAWRRVTAPSPPEIAPEGLDPELADAIEAARQKIRHDPYSAARWGDLGSLLRGALLLPDAVACFAQAERLDPKTPRWPYLQGEALRLYDVRAALPPIERAAALADTGTVAPHLRLAEVLLALGRDEEAETHLRRAGDIEPDNASVHYNLGILALARDDLPGALDHLRHCQHSFFTRQKACIQLAAVYQRMGNRKEADKYGRKADSLPPDASWPDPFAAEALAAGRPARFRQVEDLETREDYREAARQLVELIRERPEYRAYVGLGRNLGKLGDFARAEEALRSAIDMDRDKSRAYYELGRLLWTWAEVDGRKNAEQAKARYEEGAALARQAIARRPDHAMSYIVLGLCLRGLGERKAALSAFRTAVACSPDLTDAHLRLGETLADAGQLAEARTALERAVQLARPDDPRPRAALAKLKKN
jgi:tetratricopeptide (TPR) repeat protein